MRTAARTKGRMAAVSRPVSIPAPIGGLNSRDSLAAMAPSDAVILENLFPATTELVLRKGYKPTVTGFPGQVETLMVYSNTTTQELWAVSGGNVYNASGTGAVPAASVSGLTNSRWQYCNISTAGGNFLSMANGLDGPRLYNGSAWSTPSITGVTSTKLNSPIVFKNRQFFIEKASLKTWYLPVQSIAGAANAIDVSAVAQLGGYIVAHSTWTLDAGTGVDDYYVIVTSRGEIIVYQGTDPSSVDTWSLRGVWRLGAPVGERCLFKLGGDVLIICQDGLLPLSAALQSSRVNPRVALTDKIQWTISEAVTNYGTNFGWEVFYYPGENQLWLNVPEQQGQQVQYAMNTVSTSWCKYTGYKANTFALFNEQAYYAGDKEVGKAWFGLSDNGSNISAVGLQAFNAYGASGLLKRFTMTRPIIRASTQPTVQGGMKIDFDTDVGATALNFAPSVAGTWDNALWDSGVWGAGYVIYQAWQGVTGVGYYGAPYMKITSGGADVRWVSTDVVYETGQVL